jgi:hypothetical protein
MRAVAHASVGHHAISIALEHIRQWSLMCRNVRLAFGVGMEFGV